MKEPLWNAVYREDIDELERLLKSDFNFTCQASNGHTLLMQAAEMENVKIAKYLISKGADVNTPGYKGATPLHIAVDVLIDGNIQNEGLPDTESLKFIEFLLDNGADPNLKDAQGNSALDWAKSYKSKKVEMLLTRKNT